MESSLLGGAVPAHQGWHPSRVEEEGLASCRESRRPLSRTDCEEQLISNGILVVSEEPGVPPSGSPLMLSAVLQPGLCMCMCMCLGLGLYMCGCSHVYMHACRGMSGMGINVGCSLITVYLMFMYVHF